MAQGRSQAYTHTQDMRYTISHMFCLLLSSSELEISHSYTLLLFFALCPQVATALHAKVYISPQRYEKIKCFAWSSQRMSMLTCHKRDARIHVVDMWYVAIVVRYDADHSPHAKESERETHNPPFTFTSPTLLHSLLHEQLPHHAPTNSLSFLQEN